jgi:hypothetical protein
MDAFHQSLLTWQVFYATVGAAAATLTGLLFVSLSINREKLKGNQAHLTRSMARRTFGDFLYVLMIALIFLIPHQVAYSLTVALLVLGLSRGVGLILEATHLRQPKGKRLGAPVILREIGFPLLATIGLLGVAIAIALGSTNSMYWLVLVIAALLVSACWNAWLLLMVE